MSFVKENTSFNDRGHYTLKVVSIDAYKCIYFGNILMLYLLLYFANDLLLNYCPKDTTLSLEEGWRRQHSILVSINISYRLNRLIDIVYLECT